MSTGDVYHRGRLLALLTLPSSSEVFKLTRAKRGQDSALVHQAPCREGPPGWGPVGAFPPLRGPVCTSTAPSPELQHPCCPTAPSGLPRTWDGSLKLPMSKVVPPALPRPTLPAPPPQAPRPEPSKPQRPPRLLPRWPGGHQVLLPTEPQPTSHQPRPPACSRQTLSRPQACLVTAARPGAASVYTLSRDSSILPLFLSLACARSPQVGFRAALTLPSTAGDAPGVSLPLLRVQSARHFGVFPPQPALGSLPEDLSPLSESGRPQLVWRSS